jgi:BirA family biotin operon repressor/biotin-[acetyl-CoA-carboxylase] ligase
MKYFNAGGKTFAGVIKGVRDSGLLVVQNNNDEELEFSLKEIEFLI